VLTLLLARQVQDGVRFVRCLPEHLDCLGGRKNQ
jgi:hypothetical protein